MLNAHDVDTAERLLAKLEAVRNKLSKIVTDELGDIVDYADMLKSAPYFTEWCDDMVHKAKVAAEKTINDYEMEEETAHRRQESTSYARMA